MIEYYMDHPVQLLYDTIFKLLQIWWLPVLVLVAIGIALALDKKHNFTR